MKTIQHSANSRDPLLHIETEGGVVNIRVGLTDAQGRKVTSISVSPDQYVGEEWHLDGLHNTRLIEGVGPVRSPQATTLAEKLRARLQEYDDTLATPGQAQDIAEADLLHDVRAICDRTEEEWRESHRTSGR